MRSRFSLLTYLIAIVLVGCAAGGAGAPETTVAGHSHLYQLARGDEVGFTNQTDIIMEMDVPELPIPQPMEMSISMIQRLVVEDVKDGLITGELVNEDFSLSGMGEMLSEMGIGDLENMRMPVKMTDRGHSELSISTEQSGLSGGMIVVQLSFCKSLPAILPLRVS